MKIFIITMLLLGSQISYSTELPGANEMWLRAAPPNAKMMAAYVTLDNQTAENLNLVGAYAPDFGMAEIHKTVEVDGMFRMREQKQLALNAQSTIVMEPGGLHIMLMMPQRTIQVGDEVRICLIYQNQSGEELIQHLDFPVKKQ